MAIKPLSPFKLWTLENFPFIAEDFDALTNYEMMCKIVGYLNEVIAVTNEQTKEINDLYNWFNSLDVNAEIDSEVDKKLDEMVEDGTLANIINNELLSEINSKLNNIPVYPYYDVKANGGHDDGENANDTLFSTAKSSGYRKFYFAQNSDGNANYYFTNTPNFNDCTLIVDEGVIINLPNLSGIDNTKNGKYYNDITLYSRQQSKSYTLPKNVSNSYNQFALPSFNVKNERVYRIGTANAIPKLYTYDYSDTGYFIDNSASISTYFQEIQYNIRYKARSYKSLLCVPLDKTKRECFQIVTTPQARISFGWLDSTLSNIKGIYSTHTGVIDGHYYFANGTSTPDESTNYTTTSNLWTHYGASSLNHAWNYPIKYMLRNNPEDEMIELFVNDIFVCAYPYGTPNINYIGFGLNEDRIGAGNLSSDLGFSDIIKFEAERVPVNTNLKILLAGDSRTYGYNSQYKIDDVLKNGLATNGINNVIIDNISVSGWTIDDVNNALDETDLSAYDMVIAPVGINDRNNTYTEMISDYITLCQKCITNKVFLILPPVIPVGWGGTDSSSIDRAKQYYNIQQSCFAARQYFYGYQKFLIKNGLNYMGTNILQNNESISNDGVHPTTKGTILFAKGIVDMILNLFN